MYKMKKKNITTITEDLMLLSHTHADTNTIRDYSNLDYSDPDSYIIEHIYHESTYGSMCMSCVHWDGYTCDVGGICEYERIEKFKNEFNRDTRCQG
jgi:hypothetical protein